MKFFWGILIVFVGIVLLGVNLGWWESSAAVSLWQFWPFILILLGLGLIFRRWRFGWIVVLIIFLAGLWLAFGILLPNKVYSPIKTESINTEKSVFSANLEPDITSAEINIKSGASELNISSSSDKLVDGTSTGPFEEEMTVKTLDKKAIVEINTIKNNRSLKFYKNRIDLKLTNKIPLTINIDSGASSIQANYSDLILAGGSIKAGASSLNIKIGKIQNNPEFDINAGASSIDISTANDLGVLIKVKSGLSSRDFKDYTKNADDNYESPDYQNKNTKMVLNIEAGASSISVSSY